MFINNSGNDPMKSSIEDLRKIEDSAKTIEIPNMTGMQTEYAIANKWYAYFPIANVLGKSYSNLELNVVRFSIPQMIMGSTTVSFKGYELERPTHLIDAGTKEITLDYIVDAKWQNYRSLFKWCSATEGQINNVISTTDVVKISPSDFIDCRIYLLDHFKNKIISFCFHDCWIKIFQDLALETNSTEEVHHSITFAYANYEIEDC